MKKASKYIVLLVALTFLFSLAVPAFANGASATNRLMGLGIVEGDPNGDLRLGDTITRAEFAKVAVIAAGMEDAAAVLASAPSQFSDVKAGAWYTGWINVAAAQGLVKGDPNGTFRPNDEINGAEVVTVLLRILGYNDNLPGSWPTDYIVKAAGLGVMKDVAFNASQAAVRGDVFTMASASLDQKTVTYDKDKDKFGEEAKTLLAESFEGTKVEKKLVQDVKVVDGAVKLVIGADEITVSDSVTVTGADSVYAVADKFVDYTVIKVKDKDQVIAVDVKDTTVKTFKAKAISYPGADSLIQAGTKTSDQFDLASDVVVYLDFAKVAIADADDPADGILDEVKAAINGKTYEQLDLVLNSKEEVVAIKAYGDATALAARLTIVDKVEAAKLKITAKSGANIDLDEKDDDLTYLILKNGKKVDFADLAQYDLVYDFGSRKGVNEFLYVVSNTAEGEFTKLSGTDVYVGSTKYSAGATQKVYNDEGDEVAIVDFLGEDITVYKDFLGKAAVVLGPEVEKTEIIGMVTTVPTDDTDARTGTTWFIKLFTKGGEKVTYDFDEDYVKGLADVDNDDTPDLFEALATQDIVKVQLNSDGNIKSISSLVDVSAAAVANTDDANVPADGVNDYKSFNKKLEEDLSRIDVDDAGDYKYVTADTVFFNAINTSKPALTDWATLKGLSDATAKITLAYKASSKDALEYVVVVSGSLAAEAKKGVYVGAFTDADKKDRVEVSFDGTITTYEKGTVDADVAKYDIVEVTISNGKANLNVVAGAEDEDAVAIESINSTFKVVTLDDATQFVVSDSTEVVSVVDNKVEAISFSDLEVDDEITVVIKDGVATLIVKH